MGDAPSRAMAERMLRRYAEDAARLPLDRLLPAARETGFDPTALLSLGGGDVALVLRRLANLPRGGRADFGLAVCDASGALLFRRRLASFSIPRFGPGCPLWPLYAALARPGQPDMALLETPNAGRFHAWSVAQPVAQTGFGSAPVMQATMLISAIDAKRQVHGGPIRVGPGCPMCPRTDCAARR
jgi:predicted transcriptional regulator